MSGSLVETLPSIFYSQLGLTVDGSHFQLYPDYAYLVEPYDMYCMPDAPKDVVIEKGAQMGWTVWAILMAIYGAHAIYDQHQIYYFPTDRMSDLFSKSRFSPMLKENAKFAEIVTSDSASLKGIRNTNGKIRWIDQLGMHSAQALKSIPSDHNWYDEADEMDDARIDRSYYRLSNSKYKRTSALSTPTLTGSGVDQQFAESDQRYWFIKCGACGERTCLEHEFPECLHRRQNGTVFRACKKCGEEIHPRDGQWVATWSDIALRGYRIAQLNNVMIEPATILNEWETHKNDKGKDIKLSEFHNQRLATGFIEADAQLAPEQVFACCKDEAVRVKLSDGPCAFGVDVKEGAYHYLVGHRTADHYYRILDLGIARSRTQLADIAKDFHVERAAIDALPDVNAIKEFCRAFPWAWRVYLRDTTSTTPIFKSADKTITANRNDAIEAAFNAVKYGRLVLPRRTDSTLKEVVEPFTNMAKVVQEDPETKIVKVRWVTTGAKNNDMWMAFVHFILAADRVPSTVERVRAEGTPLSSDYDPLSYADEASFLST